MFAPHTDLERNLIAFCRVLRDQDLLVSPAEVVDARLVWLNPLLGDPGYRPVARTMRAALAHVDVFASAHNLASLEAVGRELTV